jgi:hypothetical protein
MSSEVETSGARCLDFARYERVWGSDIFSFVIFVASCEKIDSHEATKITKKEKTKLVESSPSLSEMLIYTHTLQQSLPSFCCATALIADE